ncbi:hypothetical protein KAS50_06175 [bacterium]|nr:hypothetical protein [bacterium]
MRNVFKIIRIAITTYNGNGYVITFIIELVMKIVISAKIMKSHLNVTSHFILSPNSVSAKVSFNMLFIYIY